MPHDSPGDDHDLRRGDGEGDPAPPPPGLVARGPIPEELYSLYEERPFKACTRCGEGLADFPEGYRISKVLRRGEVVFEYALCGPCLQSMHEEASEESKRALARFQAERFRRISGTLECALCDRARADLPAEDYALVGICVGEGLVDSNLVCGSCMEEMNQVVSAQTRRGWDRFVEENFPGVPPDFHPLPVERPDLVQA